MDIVIGSDGEILSDYLLEDDNLFNYEEEFNDTLREIKENYVDTKGLDQNGDRPYIQNMADEEWEQLGRDIAKNTHLATVCLYDGALNDHKISCLFQGLTGSSSIKKMTLYRNQLSAAAVRSMVPFLHNANNLTELDLDGNNLQSEGFNMIFRTLRDSPVERLNCGRCGIESIEISIDHIPRNLKRLSLSWNNISSDGCRGLAKLLQGGDATLRELNLNKNKIDDEGVSVLVNALQNNTSLTTMCLEGNNMSKHGQIMFLKLVNDISSIEATLRSNHTLTELNVEGFETQHEIQEHIYLATEINRHEDNPESAGMEKVIQTQLDSETRAMLAELQGVYRSVYSDIDPLHLPEVLSLIGRHYDERDMYVALKSSIAALISTVNVKEFLHQQRAYHRAKLDAIEDKIAAIEAAEGLAEKRRDCSSGNKRHRT